MFNIFIFGGLKSKLEEALSRFCFFCNYGEILKKTNALLSTFCSDTVRPVSGMLMGGFLCGPNESFYKAGINSFPWRITHNFTTFIRQSIDT